MRAALLLALTAWTGAQPLSDRDFAAQVDVPLESLRESSLSVPQTRGGRVRSAAALAASAQCRLKLAADGAVAAHLDTACREASDDAAVEGVASCHRLLRAAGVDPLYHATACQGAAGPDAARAVASCHERLRGMDFPPHYHGMACSGVQDPRGVESVLSCHGMLSRQGVERGQLGMACAAVRDEAGAQAVSACHEGLKGAGIDARYHTMSCRGVPDRATADFLTACHQRLQAGDLLDPSYFGSACRGMAAGAPAPVTPTRLAPPPAPAAAAPAPGVSDRYYATSCAELGRWRENGAPRPGPFDMKGPLLVLLSAEPQRGQSVLAQDSGRRAKRLLVARVEGARLYVRADASSRRTRRLSLCALRGR